MLESYSYWTGFVWGLAILFSFLGWGAAVARAAGVSEQDRDGALCACWGMAFVAALGGLLALVSLADRIALITIALAGCVLAAAFFRPRRAKLWEPGALLIFAITLIVWYAPSVASRNLEPYDDYLAYFPFARRFLETGTLIEPFSLRRLLSYGGQSLLHAVTIAVGSEKGIHILDSGICMIVLGGLTYRLFREFAGPWWAAAGSIAVLLVPIARHNAASQATAIALWIALFLTLKIAAFQRVPQRGSMALAGLLAAALCALRNTHIVAILVLGAAMMTAALVDFLRGERRFPDLRALWRMSAWACGAIAPWAILSYRSSGSLLYPVFKGYQTEGIHSSLQASWTVKALAIPHFLAEPAVLFILVPLLAAAIWTRDLSVRFAGVAISLALVFPWADPLTDTRTIYRYWQPLAWGSLLIGAVAVIREHRKAAVALGLLMSPMWAMYAVISVQAAMAALSSLPAEIADRNPALPRERMSAYQLLNAALPAKASVFAIVPLPSLLDYRSHGIFNADFIGFASLPPGLPFFRGPAELKKYLLSAGIEYIAYNDFDHPTTETGYWRSWWRDQAPSRLPYFRGVIPLALDLMQNVDELATTEGTFYRSGDLRVIHLTAEPARTAGAVAPRSRE